MCVRTHLDTRCLGLCFSEAVGGIHDSRLKMECHDTRTGSCFSEAGGRERVACAGGVVVEGEECSGGNKDVKPQTQ